MNELLLILLLFGDGESETTAKALAAELTRLGGARVQVVIGAEAVKRLGERGVRDGDLLATPNVGTSLTAADPGVALVRIERRSANGDVVVESRVWCGGAASSHVAIAGKAGETDQSVLKGVLAGLGARFPRSAEAVAAIDEAAYAKLVELADWDGLLKGVVGVEPKTPRQWYYQVMARSRLGHRAEAMADLAAMRKAHGDHFLVAAAAELIPPERAAGSDAVVEDGNVLRDAAPPPVSATTAEVDDGSNVLH